MRSVPGLLEVSLRAVSSLLLRPHIYGWQRTDEAYAALAAQVAGWLPPELKAKLLQTCAGLRLLDGDVFRTLWSQDFASFFSSLTLPNCPLLPGSCMAAVVQDSGSFPRVVSLCLTGMLTLNDKDLAVLLSCVPNLRELNVSGCPLLSELSVEAIGACEAASSLLVLNLCKNWRVANWAALHPCTQLRALNLTGCWLLTSADLGSLLLRLSALQGLVLTHCHQVDDSCLEAVLKSRASLSLVRIDARGTGLGDVGLLLLALLAPGLQQVQVSNCRAIGNLGLFWLLLIKSLLLKCSGMAATDHVPSCAPLSCLAAAGLAWSDDNNDEEVAPHVLSQSPLLEMLEACCLPGGKERTHVTEGRWVGSEAMCSTWSQFKVLAHTHTAHSPEEALAWLEAHLAHMTCLDLSSCTEVSDTTLAFLGSHLAGLQILSLANCNASDQGLQHLTSLSNLVQLDVSNCGCTTNTLRHPGSGFLHRHKRRCTTRGGVGDAGVRALATMTPSSMDIWEGALLSADGERATLWTQVDNDTESTGLGWMDMVSAMPAHTRAAVGQPVGVRAGTDACFEFSPTGGCQLLGLHRMQTDGRLRMQNAGYDKMPRSNSGVPTLGVGFPSRQLTGCEMVDAAGTGAIGSDTATVPGNLRSLRFAGAGMSDEGLQLLSGLTSVRLHNCKRLTDAGVLQLLLRCPGLQVLTLTGCSGLSLAALGCHWTPLCPGPKAGAWPLSAARSAGNLRAMNPSIRQFPPWRPSHSLESTPPSSQPCSPAGAGPAGGQSYGSRTAAKVSIDDICSQQYTKPAVIQEPDILASSQNCGNQVLSQLPSASASRQQIRPPVQPPAAASLSRFPGALRTSSRIKAPKTISISFTSGLVDPKQRPSTTQGANNADRLPLLQGMDQRTGLHLKSSQRAADAVVQAGQGANDDVADAHSLETAAVLSGGRPAANRNRTGDANMVGTAAILQAGLGVVRDFAAVHNSIAAALANGAGHATEQTTAVPVHATIETHTIEQPAAPFGESSQMPLLESSSRSSFLHTLSLPHGLATEEALLWLSGRCHLPIWQPLLLHLCSCSLRSLELAGSSRVTDAGIRQLALGCPQLTSLQVFGAERLGNDALFTLVEECPLLSKLAVTGAAGVTDAGVACIAGLRCLLSLDLSHCRKVGNAGFEKWAEGDRVLDGEKTLLEGVQNVLCEGLNPASEPMTPPVSELTSILAVHEWTRPVSEPMVCHGEKRVAKVAALSTGLPLRSLKLDGCTGITDQGMSAVARLCPDLHTVSLCGLASVTERVLAAFARYCQNIAVLQLAGTNVWSLDILVGGVNQAASTVHVLTAPLCEEVAGKLLNVANALPAQRYPSVSLQGGVGHSFNLLALGNLKKMELPLHAIGGAKIAEISRCRPWLQMA